MSNAKKAVTGGIVRRFGFPLFIFCLGLSLLLVGISCQLRFELNSEEPESADLESPQTEGVQTAQAPANKPADNSSCMVCHLDFEAEELTVQHVNGGVGCTDCHGDSAAHGGDEWNIIPPDVLLGRAEIDPFCKTCHPTHEASEKYDAFVKEWSGKRRPNGRPVDDGSVCTDCHGNHAVLTPDQQAAVPAE